MSEKLKPVHLHRKAMLYIRQSSPHQVQHNDESGRLQYAMKRRLSDLGWQHIEVVDDDLGRTASGTADRVGFSRMVAEVGLGKVGAVAARELSRFARNSRDWHHLIEMCSLVDTVLVDQEMIYDPRRSNDRLLLGLKGSLNEYELDLLRQRSVAARQAKARRGELVIVAPVGYIKSLDHGLEKDPDKRVQRAIEIIFEKFFEVGSARQTLMWFLDNQLEIPALHFGPTGWEVIWQRPSYAAIHAILSHPSYAGAYVYGRTTPRTVVVEGQFRRRVERKQMEDWSVLIQDHHPAYISWETYERIQRMMSKNVSNFRADSPGAAKRGPALLCGMLICRRCGRRLVLQYTGTHRQAPRYSCFRGYLDSGEPKCISFGGGTVDEAVSREILRVVEPWAVEAAVQAASEEAMEQDSVIETLEIELKAARYSAAHARKQYDAIDPENRLVAAELEKRWNEALKKVQHLEDRIEEERHRREKCSQADLETFVSLADDLPRIWQDPKTDARLKKRIIRTLIEFILVDINENASEIELVIHWKGGVHTTLRVPRRRRGASSGHTSKDIVDAVCQLALICTDDIIASSLNRNGLKTGMGNRWTRQRVASLRSKRKIPRHCPERQEKEGWLNLTAAASHAGVSSITVRRLIDAGILEARHPLPDGPWIIHRDWLERPAVKKSLDKSKQRNRGPAQPASEQCNLEFSDR
ncbi:MAG: recombinase family protein [Candidatus Hermodarchaeia archaeon]|jgi:DNA invertase Pin-like site-specific DNA recombinase